MSRDRVGYVAYGQKWRIQSVTRESESPQRQVWVTKSGDTVITFLEDPYLELRYVVVQGAQVSEIAHTLRSSLPCWTVDEALEFLRQSRTPDERIHGIYLIAASASSEEDSRVVAIFQNLTHDENPEVRQALLVGMGYLESWPIVRHIASSILENDPNTSVRRSAEYLLEGLDQSNAT
ncbi:HEAT repeat domain-containing protein [Streptomyces sp. 110]|uniref:HEAT repeat domain-containing protein n=1 Tax=Streptomyces endocoffeicus TaxID=2898945 RepID=A0ABS1PX13_9ACTN|nr:HEAT repeat domain-containing protein [Streptomyces endocoffeicus]MBL1116958.1 HEAT repeat domain-containing protein [Streptomyces endocoffeicus]